MKRMHKLSFVIEATEETAQTVRLMLEKMMDESDWWILAHQAAVADVADHSPLEPFELVESGHEPYPLDDRYSVTVYKEYRLYGGPEEGGWWYDAAEPVDDAPVRWYYSLGAAREGAAAWNAALEGSDLNSRPLSSVLSDGRYVAYVCEGFPEPFPKERPVYE